ncbi:MAG: enoyl-CoA hydratase-related protein [Lysobacterales bacterium]
MTQEPAHLRIDSPIPGVTQITLNRPTVHNAFNAELVSDLHQQIRALDSDASVRAIVLTGAGKSFSAGADLKWVKHISQADEATNFADAMALADLLRTLAHTRTPTLARVNGAAYGGGIGLIACCDIAIADRDASFGLTETRLGLVPAVISPYVVNALGPRQATRLFMTGQSFDAQTACQLGLVHGTASSNELDNAIEEQLTLLLKGGPQALYAAKSLVGAVAGRTADSQKALDQATAKLIASLRVSPEGQEGVAAFLEKRPANWIQSE